MNGRTEMSNPLRRRIAAAEIRTGARKAIGPVVHFQPQGLDDTALAAWRDQLDIEPGVTILFVVFPAWPPRCAADVRDLLAGGDRASSSSDIASRIQGLSPYPEREAVLAMLGGTDV